MLCCRRRRIVGYEVEVAHVTSAFAGAFIYINVKFNATKKITFLHRVVVSSFAYLVDDRFSKYVCHIL